MDDPTKDPKRSLKGNTGKDYAPPKSAHPAPKGMGGSPVPPRVQNLDADKARKIAEIQQREAEKAKLKEQVRTGGPSFLATDFKRVR
ncbi:hypothetical protein FJ945_29825 [Mesorhizobium sp. B2-4-9]|uniref:hypothetical protein n=1 Tax=Mesorhizobium sp. B2-4-9 TaxID=2589940 RepID=UPI00112632E1|nr:hypothetical protein [Mesorhizobium sp. B2-4-9]TPL14818.1 hypothetical protein FJ945_29825 [Mesorhizobium sp. B2-4-9]